MEKFNQAEHLYDTENKFQSVNDQVSVDLVMAIRPESWGPILAKAAKLMDGPWSSLSPDAIQQIAEFFWGVCEGRGRLYIQEKEEERFNDPRQEAIEFGDSISISTDVNPSLRGYVP